MLWRGVALALAAAVNHTAIDTTRKHAALTVSVEALVCVVSLLEALVACSSVAAAGGFKNVTIVRPGYFAATSLISSSLLLAAKFMFQRALQLSPLSLTIPYLSLTPAFLVVTAYVILGEVPSPMGLAGVAVVALGGYLLNRKAASAAASSSSSSTAGPAPPPAGKLDGDGGAPAHGVYGGGGGLALPVHRSASCCSVLDPEPGGALALALAGEDDAKRPRGSKYRRTSSMMDVMMHVGRQPGGLVAALQQQEPGVVLMLAVAAIWSLTASLDKLGVMSGSPMLYLATQRAVSAVLSLTYIVVKAPGLLRYLRTHPFTLLCIAVLECSAVVLFLLAVQDLLVSYVVAIKRCNVLFSVLMGGLFFRENIWARIPYILLMLAGVTLIVIEPQSSTADMHTHHTHRVG